MTSHLANSFKAHDQPSSGCSLWMNSQSPNDGPSQQGSYRRSISLPKHLQARRAKSLRTGAIRPTRLASQSLDPHAGDRAIHELCADLEITSVGTFEPKTPSFSSKWLTSLSSRGKLQQTATSRALAIPDILYLIFEQVDALNVVPHELSQRRRKPLSLRHARLIYGDNAQAVEAWERAKVESPTTSNFGPGAGLHSCLLVNRSWYEIARRVLDKQVFFSSGARWRQFVHAGPMSRKPRTFIVHKLGDAHQLELDQIADKVAGNLEWLEFYTCPGLVPTVDILRGGFITRLVLPGCLRVTDRTIAAVGEHCPNLQYLDLRACEFISDRGLKTVAKYCPKLELLNVGRTKGGELITYKGVKHLARQTQLNTLGLAGCAIDDRAIWELALNRGSSLQRLSLNNCRNLTDASIPRILGYTPKLSVLEIRGCTQITNMRPLALFKRYREQQCGQPPLIEGCEIIERRMQSAIHRLNHEISTKILSDCSLWVNTADNDQFYLIN